MKERARVHGAGLLPSSSNSSHTPAARAGTCARKADDAAATPERMIARRMAWPSLAADMLTAAVEAIAALPLARSGSADKLPVNAEAGSACPIGQQVPENVSRRHTPSRTARFLFARADLLKSSSSRCTPQQRPGALCGRRRAAIPHGASIISRARPLTAATKAAEARSALEDMVGRLCFAAALRLLLITL